MSFYLFILGGLLSRLDHPDPINLLFLHVPLAWLSLIIYASLAFFSLLYLITHTPHLHLLNLALCQLGILFTSLTLLTGSLWGKMSWGTLWSWDGRLISVVVLLLLYILLYLLFQHAPLKAPFLALIGAINLPLIKFSVTWWSSLHQPPLSPQEIYFLFSYTLFIWLLLLLTYLLTQIHTLLHTYKTQLLTQALLKKDPY